MTRDQEKIAEQVIQKHKENKGVYDWKDFIQFFQTDHTDRIVIGKALREKKIIGDHITGTRLTEIGWNYAGFDNERKSLQENEERTKQIQQLTLNKLKFEQFPSKFWWLLILISMAVSILTTFINNKIQQSNSNQKINTEKSK